MKYCIHSFMIDKLKIKGGELLICAIIYSSTCGEKGLFYGTNEFLSEAGGLSLSSVKRGISSLLKKGYIEKFENDRYRGYRSCHLDNGNTEEPDQREEMIIMRVKRFGWRRLQGAAV